MVFSVHLLSRNGKLVLVDGPVYLSAPNHSDESEEQSLCCNLEV